MLLNEIDKMDTAHSSKVLEQGQMGFYSQKSHKALTLILVAGINSGPCHQKASVATALRH